MCRGTQFLDWSCSVQSQFVQENRFGQDRLCLPRGRWYTWNWEGVALMIRPSVYRCSYVGTPVRPLTCKRGDVWSFSIIKTYRFHWHLQRVKKTPFFKNADLEHQKITLSQWKCLKKDPFCVNHWLLFKKGTLFYNIKDIQKTQK